MMSHGYISPKTFHDWPMRQILGWYLETFKKLPRPQDGTISTITHDARNIRPPSPDSASARLQDNPTL